MNDKQRVGRYAADQVQAGMIVGLGTGTTTNHFIEALAKRYHEEGLQVQTVASSVVSTIKARQVGLPLLAIEHIDGLDLYVDGADEVSADMTLLKGRGADLVREKLLARASQEFWVLIDYSKRVERIGQNYPIPLEVIPVAWQMVQRLIRGIGGQSRLRPSGNGEGLAITSHGSLVLEVDFPYIPDIHELNEQLNSVSGIVEHGIFSKLATTVFTGQDSSVLVQTAD